MVDTGATNPGTMANDSAVGTLAWSNVDNAKISNDNYAIASSTLNNITFSNYIKATNFSFSIPTGATINGIIVENESKRNRADTLVFDENIKIIKNGVISSTNMSSGATWNTTDTIMTHGSSSELWGETWTAEDINNINFGVAISSKLNFEGEMRLMTSNIDHIRITVDYTEEVGGQTRKVKISGTFQDKPILTKVAGTFVDKPIKIKVGGTFQ